MEKIKIADRIVGAGEPCFIIAEAGVNHNGDIGLAKKLIDAAKTAGVDAVKFQTFRTEDIVSKTTSVATYQEKNIGTSESQQEMLKKLELSYDDFVELKKYCDEKGIIFLSTPHTEDAIDFLENLIPAYKTGSGDLINLPFLKKVAKKGKPIILSTGMSTMQEVEEALEAIYEEGNNQVIVLHCTTDYPCPFEDANLRVMQAMKEKFNCLVGYSDHTLGVTVPIIAVSLGAAVIEKHFTTDKNLYGPDHKASLEPNELKKMVEEIRKTETALGSSDKTPTGPEKEIMKVIRKSIVAKRDIKAGDIIEREMLTIKRPGTGIEPKFIGRVLGKKTKKPIKKDEIIGWDKLI